MALTRAMLKGMGLTEEQVGAIIEEHENTISGLKSVRDQYKEEASKLPGVQKELDELKESIKDTKSVPKSEYDKVVTERDTLKTEFDTYKKGQEQQAAKQSKQKAYRDLLKEAGVADKHLDSILKVSSVDDIEIGDDGKIKESDKILENVKKEWSDFISTTGSVGAGTETPPKNVGGGSGSPSKATLLARQYHENLYGKIKED